MKKNIEWLKSLINEEGIVMDMHLLGRLDEKYWKNENIKINKGRLFYLIDQLDEPEKPVIPKFVADWIEKQMKFGYEDVFISMTRLRERAPEKVKFWFRNNSDTYARAWLDGYEVEKEKKYHIKFSHNQYACRFNEEAINSTLVTKYEASEFTEAEIKAIDGRLMVFAQEVTE